MLPLGACAATDEFIADAQSQTETIDEDLGRVGTQLVNLPWHLRAEVEDAVGLRPGRDGRGARRTRGCRRPPG